METELKERREAARLKLFRGLQRYGPFRESVAYHRFGAASGLSRCEFSELAIQLAEKGQLERREGQNIGCYFLVPVANFKAFQE